MDAKIADRRRRAIRIEPIDGEPALDQGLALERDPAEGSIAREE